MFKSLSILKIFMSAACIIMVGTGSPAYADATGDGNSFKRICHYGATPQGFGYFIGRRVYPPNDYRLFIFNNTPMYYSGSQVSSMTGLCAQSSNGNQQQGNSSCLVGTQNIGSPYGGLDGGGSFVRDSNDVPINGNVYLNKGGGIAPVYSGGVKSVTLSGATKGDCTSFGYIAKKGGVPVVNAASKAWNNRAPLQNHSDPVVDHSDMLQGSPGGGFSSELLYSYLQGTVNDDWGAYALYAFPDLNATLGTHSRAEIQSLKARFESMGMGDYFGAVYKSNRPENSGAGKFIYVPLDPGTSTIQLIEEEDIKLTLLPRSMEASKINQYMTVFRPIGGNSGITVKSIYPSNLYDPPKHSSWYAGKLASPGDYGHGATYYKHDPLPTTCHPNSPAYIPAAFFNADVLEELRHDWRFLSLKNIADLKNKYKIEFTDKSYMSYIRPVDDSTNQFLDVEACTLVRDGSDNDCDGGIVWDREHQGLSTDHIFRPELPLQTMPVDGNPNLNTVVTGKGDKKKGVISKLQSKKKWKPKRKTDAYYDDLVNNELITMNPSWSKNACKPKYSATATSSLSIKKPKPLMNIKKPIQKNKLKKEQILNRSIQK